MRAWIKRESLGRSLLDENHFDQRFSHSLPNNLIPKFVLVQISVYGKHHFFTVQKIEIESKLAKAEQLLIE